MTTVLVVEDEVNIANVVRIALERDGHRVIAVRTGEEALTELTRHPIALIVLDLGLPGWTGSRSAAACGPARGCRSSC